MKNLLADLARWWNDPVTEKALTVIGVLVLMNGLAVAERAHHSASDAHERIDKLERVLEALGR